MKVLDLLDFFLTFTTLKAGRIPWPAGAGYYVHGAEGYGRVQDVCKVLAINPKSVIRHAESVFDWESEAFGHLARLCPHPVSRAA